MIEADFARFYRANPLTESWRRFRVLLAALPEEAMFVAHLRAEAQARDPYHALGIERPANTISLDDYVAETRGA